VDESFTSPQVTVHGDGNGYSDGASARGIVGFRDVLAVARRSWLVLLTGTLLGGMAAGYMAYRDEPRYRAAAVVRLADARQAIAGGMDVPIRELDRLTNPLLSQIQILRSRGVLGQVVDAEGLRLDPSFRRFAARLLTDVHVDSAAMADTLDLTFDSTHVTVRSSNMDVRVAYGDTIALDGVRFVIAGQPKSREETWYVLSREEAIDELLARLRISPRSETDIVDVSYIAERPWVAQRVVNAVVTTFQRVNAQSAQDQSRRRRIFLSGQLHQTDSMLAEAQFALSSFRKRWQVSSSRDKLTAQQRDLMALEMRIEELEADRRMYRSLLARVEQAPGSIDALQALVSAREIGANPVVLQLYRQLTEYQTARDSLTTGTWRSAETNPDVQRLNQLITTASENLVAAVRSHLASLDARSEALRELRARSGSEIEQLPGAEAEEMRLLEQVESLRRLADQLRDDYHRASVAEAVEAGQVEIVDLAALPLYTVGIPRQLQLALGLVLGFVLAATGVLLRETLNTSIRRRRDVEAVLRIPSLAVIPRMISMQVNRGALTPVYALKSKNGSSLDPLPTAREAPSRIADAYRTLRTNLLFAPGGRAVRTLVVTSAAPGEGKTVTAANLAVTLAREGKRVLLVDADLRRSRLHRLFGVPNSPGLTDILATDVVSQVLVTPTAVDGLFVLPNGHPHHNPAELLRSDKLRPLLEAMSAHFDVVVLDSPPVLSAADSLILAAMTDGVVLVVRAGRTDRGVAADALARLSAVGAQVIGAVLNDPTGQAASYGEYAFTYAETHAS
jgi:capsular exopolysaccharide synthesis family protein